MIKIALLVALVSIAICSGSGSGGSGYPPKQKKVRYPTPAPKYPPKPKYEMGKEQTYGKTYEAVQEYRELPEPTLDQIKEILPWEEYEIVPDVIDEQPKEIAQVNYQTSGVYLIYGNILTPFQTHREPSVYWKADKYAYYTLIMIDADQPTRAAHLRQEWLQWMVVNIPGSSISKGDVIAEYVGPIPEKNTGLHRVIVLIFKQYEKQEFKNFPLINKNTAKGRYAFNTRQFAKEYYLGELVAGNFFQAEWDKYVLTAERLLGIEAGKSKPAAVETQY